MGFTSSSRGSKKAIAGEQNTNKKLAQDVLRQRLPCVKGAVERMRDWGIVNVKGNNKLKICLSYEAFQCEILGKNNVRLYVDEFLYSTAFCNNFLNFKSLHNIIQNGYFVSSINTDRYHIYSQLKELNNNLVNSMYTSSGDFL